MSFAFGAAALFFVSYAFPPVGRVVSAKMYDCGVRFGAGVTGMHLSGGTIKGHLSADESSDHGNNHVSQWRVAFKKWLSRLPIAAGWFLGFGALTVLLFWRHPHSAAASVFGYISMFVAMIGALAWLLSALPIPSLHLLLPNSIGVGT